MTYHCMTYIVCMYRSLYVCCMDNFSIHFYLRFTIQSQTLQYNTIQSDSNSNVITITITLQYITITITLVQYSTVQYSTVQYNTVQYSSIQCSTVQYSTVVYSTIQYSTVYCLCVADNSRGSAPYIALNCRPVTAL